MTTKAPAAAGKLTALIDAKLAIPRQPRDLVLRQLLTQKLHAAMQRKLTLVCAPAGFGKTTAVAATLFPLVQPSERAAGEPAAPAIAWFTIDATDDDLGGFAAYLVAAIRQSLPEQCRSATAALQSPSLLTPADLAANLLADLAGVAHDLVIVLDDYHQIKHQVIHDFVEALLRNLPAQVHLVICTRTLPPFALARLRVRGDVTEVRVADLCFQQEETVAFLNAVAGRPLAPDLAAAIGEQIAGWVAGLRLLGLVLQAEDDPQEMLGRLQPNGHDYLFEYLVQEVLDGLPAPVHAFLLKTALLADLTPGLCAMVLGEAATPDGACAAILMELDRNQIFISQMHHRPGWYRYHPLFRTLLQSHLRQTTSPAEIAGLHSRAAAWYAGQGHVQECLRAYLAAGQPETAADQLELVRVDLLNREDLQLLDHLLGLLPPDLVAQRPALVMAQCWLAEQRDQYNLMGTLLETAEQLLTQGAGGVTPVAAVQGEIWAIRSSIDGTALELEQRIALAEQALKLLPANNLQVRGFVLQTLARLNRKSGRIQATFQPLEQIIQGVGLRPNGLTTRALQAMAIQSLHLLELERAEESARLLADVAAAGQLSLSSNNAQSILSIAACLRGNHAQVAAHLDAVFTGSSPASVDMLIFLTYYSILLANSAAGARALDMQNLLAKLRQQAWRGGNIELLALIDPLDLLVALCEGNKAAALRWALTTPTPPLDGHVLLRRLIWLRCLATAGSAAAAAYGQHAAEELVAVAFQQHNEAVLLEGRIFLSLIQHAQGNLPACLAALRPAVLVAAQRGVWLFFLAPDPTLRHLLITLVDDPEAGLAARAVLDAVDGLERAGRIIQEQEGGYDWAEQSPAVAVAPAPPWQERLTRRELQILQLLDQQLSNKEIAQILVVSPDTVRNHMSNLFAKLDVTSRTQAVFRGRALGLLGAKRG